MAYEARARVGLSAPDAPAWVIVPKWQLSEDAFKQLDPGSIWTSEHESRQFMIKNGKPRSLVAASEFHVHDCS